MDNITDVGVVTETVYTSNPYAVCNVTLASGAVWNVDKASYLMSLTVSDGATLNGYVVVDGQLTSPEAGKTYTGDIAVFATEDEAKAFAEASANDTASADTTGTGEDTAKTGISPAVIVVIIIVVILAVAFADGDCAVWQHAEIRSQTKKVPAAASAVTGIFIP